jgi:hypothetical protein
MAVRLALLHPTRSEPDAYPFHRLTDVAGGLKPEKSVRIWQRHNTHDIASGRRVSAVGEISVQTTTRFLKSVMF